MGESVRNINNQSIYGFGLFDYENNNNIYLHEHLHLDAH
jgi:hypothetical protein